VRGAFKVGAEARKLAYINPILLSTCESGNATSDMKAEFFSKNVNFPHMGLLKYGF